MPGNEGDSNRSGGVNISGGGNVARKGQIAEGDKITTHQESTRSGGTDITAGSSVTIGGDVVGGDKITTTTTSGIDAAALAKLVQQFSDIQRAISARPKDADVDADELKDAVKRIEEEVKRGEQANPNKVERWLINLGAMADDIFQVTVATLTSPALGIAKTIQLVAQKAKAEKAKLDAKSGG